MTIEPGVWIVYYWGNSAWGVIGAYEDEVVALRAAVDHGSMLGARLVYQYQSETFDKARERAGVKP